jgi:hypothetical protein
MAGKKPKGGKRLTGNNCPTSPRMISAAERQKQAIELRLAGCTFEDIAQALGYSGKGAAFKAVTKGLEKSLQEPADNLRKLQRRRLERILRSWFPLAIRSNHEGGPHEAAADKCLKILHQMAALEGLNSSKLDLGVDFHGSDEDLIRSAQAILERLGPSQTGAISPTNVPQVASAGPGQPAPGCGHDSGSLAETVTPLEFPS